MGTKAVGINQGASDSAAILSGKGARLQTGALNLGDRATYLASGAVGAGAKTGLADAKLTAGGNITVGETGLGAMFADTVTKLAATYTGAASVPAASTPLEPFERIQSAELAAAAPVWKSPVFIGGAALVLVAVLWLLGRRSG